MLAKKRRDAAFLPYLGKIIITHHYRDTDGKEMRQAAREEKDKRNYCAAMTGETEQFPLKSVNRVLKDLREAAAKFGTDIMPLHEDTAWKDIFREGPGLAVWDIP